MALDVLLGLQWGDEGKGKIVDVLASQYGTVARFQGGPNAGHTLEFDGIKHVLHQIPSGVFRPDICNVVGNGVVLDPVIFKREVEDLLGFKVKIMENLYISKKAHLILPTHRALDAAYEKAKGKNKIGSTQKGIGPTYSDKIARLGMRVGDILRPDFESFYDGHVARHEAILAQYDHQVDLTEAHRVFLDAVAFLRTMKIVDSEYFINEKEPAGVLAEGAQGSLLDIDFGSYPFVTSSNTTIAGVCSGLGVAANKIGKVFGIFKAYCTRVGSGPFPTELFDDVGEKIRTVGCEFGATTGRKRRCGWLDLPALKYAIMVNGVTELYMMKADVLNDFEEIKVCTHYKLEDGTLIDYFPYEVDGGKVEPVYQTVKGWDRSLEGITAYADFPDALKAYVSYIADAVNVPIKIVSIGPDRLQTVFV